MQYRNLEAGLPIALTTTIEGMIRKAVDVQAILLGSMSMSAIVGQQMLVGSEQYQPCNEVLLSNNRWSP